MVTRVLIIGGYGNNMNGKEEVVIGTLNTASGIQAFVTGYTNTASGDYSAAGGGLNNTAVGILSQIAHQAKEGRRLADK